MKKIINTLFGTPKKTAVSLISAVIIISALGTATVCAAHTSANSSVIGEEAAKSLAYADAGVEAADVIYVKTEFDYDKGSQIYEIDFTANGKEYEYDIKADDGSVIKKTVELLPSERNVSNSGDSVTLEDAKEIALTDAGLTAEEVTFGKTGLDRDNHTAVYDVEFYSAEAKYEYEISTSSGTIYEKSKEILTQAQQTQQSQQSGQQTAAPQDTQSPSASTNANTASAAVTLEQAKEIAAADAGISISDATFTKTKQDRDNGVTVYDIEFYTDTNEYEYEISASDGSVREKSIEARKGYSKSTGSTGGNQSADTGTYISLDEAKQIAAEKAGLSVSQVTFKKAKLDRDDGITVYEIEFYSGRTEYEVTVNASNGNIIEFEIDD
ncbi:MAG: PepSY domain-containing protein [Clostridiales bacterium]|nr:PepSY domain-containing protein [Clostridiales bacterium]